MNQPDKMKEKIRLIRREARGDKNVELLASLLYDLVDFTEDLQSEIKQMRLRLGFAGSTSDYPKK